MELLQLRYFCMVAKTESISQTATHYFVTPASISTTIAKLEKELDTKLFDRTHNKIKLNENGRLFYHDVKKALAMLDKSVERLIPAKDDVSGTVKILTQSHTALINDCVIAFQEQYPNTNFTVHLLTSKNVRLEDYDIFILSNPPALKNITGFKLSDYIIMLAVSTQNPLSNYDEVSISQLENENFFVIYRESQMWQTISALCRANGFEPRSSLSTDYPVFIRYIEQNKGCMFTLIAPNYNNTLGTNSKIKLLRLKDEGCQVSLYAFWQGNKQLSKAASLFLDNCRDFFDKRK